MMVADLTEKGWECPRCERIWSPQIAACGTCNLERQARLQSGIKCKIPIYDRTEFYPMWNA